MDRALRRATAGHAGVSGARFVAGCEAQGQGARQSADAARRAAAGPGSDVVERPARRAARRPQAADVLAAIAADGRRSRRSRGSAWCGHGHRLVAARGDDAAFESPDRGTAGDARRRLLGCCLALVGRDIDLDRRAERRRRTRSSRSLPTSCAIPRSRKRSSQSTSRGSCHSCSSSARRPASSRRKNSCAPCTARIPAATSCRRRACCVP